MVELRVNAGNVKNPNVHKIGIIALGSHLENHGPALPIDTDAKIASYIQDSFIYSFPCCFGKWGQVLGSHLSCS